MKINTALKTILETGLCRIKDLLDQTTVFSLLNAVENARQEWQQSLKEMNYMDSDLSEYIIYKINAAERRYMALLEMARKEGVTAWPPIPEYCPDQEGYAGNEAGSVKNTSLCSN
ncbi:MAG TPA: DUF2508 family protein [Bacillota bacterium]|jgi:hypothetical protein|nr:DUF2508 family protein [Peptococcaceae bacterium MAG4]NLW37521.1 DUF2508 family protein [Peptococcaceae bacterium]HPZ43612.1 DUF2508 family protein [Bacillota bacterium]HQD76122.1 DUF2508 family protein [Bacillota bacterium]HUM58825.1 DUF2508 family protein [Bacillota bacterium]